MKPIKSCVTLIGVINAVVFLGSATIVRADDGVAPQTSSDYKRHMATLHMRPGEIDVRDGKAQLSVNAYSDSQGGSGQNAQLDVQQNYLLTGESDDSHSYGMLLSPGAKVSVDRGKDGKVEVREATGTIGSFFSVQGMAHPDHNSVPDSDPRSQRVNDLGNQISAQQDVVNNAQTALTSVSVDPAKPSPEEQALEKELAPINAYTDSAYVKAKSDFVLANGKRIAIEKAEPLSKQLDIQMAYADQIKSNMDGLQQGSEIYNQLQKDYQDAEAKVLEIQKKLEPLGALTVVTYTGDYYHPCQDSAGHSVDCRGHNSNFVMNACSSDLGGKPCRGPDKKIQVGAFNSDEIGKSFTDRESWAKANVPEYADASEKTDRLVALKKQRADSDAAALDSEKAKRQAAFDAAKKKLDQLTADKAKADAELTAYQQQYSNQKTKPYATVDGRFGEIGGGYRKSAGLGIEDKGGSVNIAEGSFHVAGVINDLVPVGLCGSLAPLKVLGGEQTRPASDGTLVSKQGFAIEGDASMCAELGVGSHFLVRNTAEINTDYSKYIIFSDTTGVDVLSGHATVGYTHQTEYNTQDGQSVSRDMVGIRGAY